MTYDAESIDFRPVRAKQVARPLGVRWIHGSESAKHNTDPDIQVHWYDEHTVILRQNMAINYEAPLCSCCSAAPLRSSSTEPLLPAAHRDRQPGHRVARRDMPVMTTCIRQSWP